jgi:hypothetical protein
MSNWKKREKKEATKKRNAAWQATLPEREAAHAAYLALVNGPIEEVRVLHEGNYKQFSEGYWESALVAEMHVQVRLKGMTEWRQIGNVIELDSTRVEKKVRVTRTFFETRCLGKSFDEAYAALSRIYNYREIKSEV